MSISELSHDSPLWSQEQAIVYEGVQELLNRVRARLQSEIIAARQAGDHVKIEKLRTATVEIRDLKLALDPTDTAAMEKLRLQLSEEVRAYGE